MGGQFIFRKKGFTEPIIEEKTEPQQTQEIPNRSIETPRNTATTNDSTNTDPFIRTNSIEEWRTQMKLLVAEDLRQAFVALNAGMNRSKNKYNDLIMLRARHNSATTNAQRAVVTMNQQNVVMNQIRYAVIDLIDGIETSDLKHFKIQRH